MGFFRRHVGLDAVDTALHVFVTLCVAFVASEYLAPGSDDVVMTTVGGISAILYGIRRHRALQDRPPETTGERDAARAADIEARLAELELGQQRVLELEERVDFAERLLARPQVPAPRDQGDE